MAQRRKKRRQTEKNRLLLMLIGILAAVLVIAVIVAVCIRPDRDGGETDAPAVTDGTGEATEPTQTRPPVGLTVTAPEKTELVTVEESLLFSGSCNPGDKLTVGGSEVQADAQGNFSCTVQLRPGKNEITLVYKGETVTYRAEYRYAVQSFLPDRDTRYSCGAKIQLVVSAREGSKVSAQLNGKNISLSKDPNQMGSGLAKGFVLYTGTYALPDDNAQDLNLGPITYTVSCGNVTETYQSAEVICLKCADIKHSDPAVTPQGGEYIDVGSGYIVEVVNYSAETFNGRTTDDNSSPLNNYLPEGTVDYGAVNDVVKGKNRYKLMRCGRRVYVDKPNWPSRKRVPVVDCYKGTLPDHNEVGFSSLTQSGHFTILTFDTMWKAPFYFDLGPQEYANPDNRDFRITALTAEYVDITFCYATSFSGTVEIPQDNPMFRSAKVTQNQSDVTLRLELKQKGAFYGWDSYYNDQNQLCFKFLNPLTVQPSGNPYGADLTGIRIMLDVGHGGIDGGASVKGPNGKTVLESECNLVLAEALKKELESAGATVILNREDNSPINVDERILFLREQAPDLCISLHQNSIQGYPNINGAEISYFHPYSQKLASALYSQTRESGVYAKSKLNWHFYFVARQTYCPVVLMENGYMTNQQDLNSMLDPQLVQRKAQAMARGVADYFLK